MPPEPKVVAGVAAVVERGGNLLMIQRGGPSLGLAADGRGTWSVPGGWLEFGETPEYAAQRECWEETAVTVRPVSRAGFVTNTSPSGWHIVTLFVRCEYLGGEPSNAEPEKALAVCWMPREVLCELDLFAPFDSWWRQPQAAA